MISATTMRLNIDPILIQALQEDISSEDVTTNAIVREKQSGQVSLICKESGVLAGLDVFSRVFELLDGDTQVEAFANEGDEVRQGDLVAVIRADLRALLTGERTALNYLQRMSGIATHTRELTQLLSSSKTRLLDTRKTTPNMRIFEKYAVKVGGGDNHRYNLSDGILIKDNHIDAAGSIAKAISMTKEHAPFVRKIEIEAENLDMVREAVRAGADIIMLDNMDLDTVRKAVQEINGKAQTEYSGNVTREQLQEIADTGVDYVSCGALTHSSNILDFSMKNLKKID